MTFLNLFFAFSLTMGLSVGQQCSQADMAKMQADHDACHTEVQVKYPTTLVEQVDDPEIQV